MLHSYSGKWQNTFYFEFSICMLLSIQLLNLSQIDKKDIQSVLMFTGSLNGSGFQWLQSKLNWLILGLA